jgi:hypothetical protein
VSLLEPDTAGDKQISSPVIGCPLTTELLASDCSDEVEDFAFFSFSL